MIKTEIIQRTEEFVKNSLQQDFTGHDWYHIERVRKNALYICEQEKAGDPFVIELAALLHDIPDGKLNDSEAAGFEKLDRFFAGLSQSGSVKADIIEIVSSISFKGGKKVELSSTEAKIVQDADRLDAIGAIGIARTFAYGGNKGQAIYDPMIAVRSEMTVNEYRNGKSSSIHHFYEKLLKLRDLLHTNTAKKIAERRHRFMEIYLQEFYSEWDGQV